MSRHSRHSFSYYFRESMSSLGLPMPATIFDSQARATASVSSFLAFLRTARSGATVAELFLTATGTALAGDLVVAIGGLSAVYYVSACVGALIFATSEVVEDFFFSSTNSVWDIVNRATAMGIIIPDPVINEMAYQYARSHPTTNGNRVA